VKNVIKGVELVCPYCAEHGALEADQQGRLECTECRRLFSTWGEKPCFIDKHASGLDSFWKNGFEKNASKSKFRGRLLSVYGALKAPRARRRMPHLRLLHQTIGENQKKALFVGYSQAFREEVLEKVIQLDVIPRGNVDVVAPGEYLPFPEKSFNLVVISGVIEHTQQPFRVVSESHRVLKGGGKLYISSPWVYPFHGGDHYRFSNEGLKILCSAFDEVEVGSLDGPLHAVAIIIMQAVVEYLSFGNKYLRYGLSIPVSWLVFPLMLLDAVINRDRKKKFIFDANIYAVATKKNSQQVGSNTISG
jgi:SAM-dependent methyltransferase